MKPMYLTPRISEKAIAMGERGTYVFDVPADANKIEVAKAVAASFNVEVTDVNIMITKGKQVSRRYGKNAGHRKDVKKAMVQLKMGQKITLFEEGK